MNNYFNEEQFKGDLCEEILVNKLHSLTGKQKEKVVKHIESSTKNYLYMQGGTEDKKLSDLKVNIDNLMHIRTGYQNGYIQTGNTDYFMDVLIINGTINNIKEYIHNNSVKLDNTENSGRLPNKDLLYLKQSLEQCEDKPILYISRTYGNKYIVPQKLLDDLTNENVGLKKKAEALEIIKEKPFESANCINYLTINKNNSNMLDYKHYCMTIKNTLTEEEFNALKEMLE